MDIKIGNKSASSHFRNFESRLKIKTDKTMGTYANLIRASQWSILRNKVKEWTGNLANSIIVTKTLKGRYIGPKGVVYSRWIEYGGGVFSGYHYIRDSIKKYETSYINQLKKDIKDAI